jgi:site-specific DNA-methyltransferase (adenine-specific)
MKITPNSLINIDGIEAIKHLPENSVHLILSDIPYGIGAEDWDVLHENTNSAYLGSSPAQELAGAIFKSRGKPINGWSEADREMPAQYYKWCKSWSEEWARVLKPGGSAIVFAGRRFSHRCITAMEDSGFSYKDMLAWLKSRAAHRAQRLSVVYSKRKEDRLADQWEGWKLGNLRPVFEPILWFVKPYKIGTTIADNVIAHGLGAYNENGFLNYETAPDNVLKSSFLPKEGGLHPTQKPVLLMQALIELTTLPQHIVLDPFCGSGTTLLAAKNLNRKYIGFEINSKYIESARRRLESDLFSYPGSEETLLDV